MKQKILRIVNVLLLLSFLIQATTVLCFIAEVRMHFIFEMHELNGVMLVSLAIAHVILNWGWIKMNYLSFFRKRATTATNG